MEDKKQSKIILRFAQIEDAASIMKIRAEGWKYAYKNILSPEFLAQKTSLSTIQDKIDGFPEHLEKMMKNGDIFIVATDENRVVGFVAGGSIQSVECQADKELHSLYIDVNYIGCGLGKILIQEFAREMQKQGAQSFGLMCFTENPSIGFYKRMDGKITVERQSSPKWESKMGSFLEFYIDEVIAK